MMKPTRRPTRLRALEGSELANIVGGVTATEKPSGQTASGSTSSGTSQTSGGGKTQTTGSVLDNASF